MIANQATRARWHALVSAALLVLSILVLRPAIAQSHLPPDVQADLLRSKIVVAAKANDLRSALSSIDAYRALPVEFPSALLLIEAKAAKATGDPLRARAALEDFLSHAERNTAPYNDALNLYPAIDAAATAAAAANPARAADLARRAATADVARKLRTLGPGFAGLMADMVVIPPGTFQMGDLAGNGERDERPIHTVTLKSFRLSRYEVTFEQFDAYAQASGHELPKDNGWGRGSFPVINVSWDDAQGFISWLNAKTGGHFRLPSEAEWEYAARAGTATVYPWGDTDDVSRRNGFDSVRRTSKVGSYPENAFGVYDMIGNVWEWVQDCKFDSYSGAPTDGSAWESPGCWRRVFRDASMKSGPSWVSFGTGLRASIRASYGNDRTDDRLGFRLAQDL